MSGVIGALEEAVLNNPLDCLMDEEIETELLKLGLNFKNSNIASLSLSTCISRMYIFL